MVSYLSSSKRAQPPALAAAGVLLQNGEQVAAPERQLVRRLRNVVVQRARHALQQRNETIVVTKKRRNISRQYTGKQSRS